ncbi:MAG TPA: hypothetical protein VER55_02795, partial [Ardenticatenaceae bacterium]|nr:hypothetical protein [Ardenticatenaceae bacterium]
MVTTASRQPVALVVVATRAQLRRFGPAVEQAGYRLTIMKEAMSDAIQNVAAQPADLLVYNGSASVHSTISRYRALPESPALVRLEGELAVPGDGFTAGEQVPLDPQQLESLLRGHLDRQNGHAGPAAPPATNQPSPLREGEIQGLPEPVSPPEAPVADDSHDQDELLAELAVLRQELNDLRAQIADERRAHAGLLAPGHQVAALSSQDMNGGQMEPANVQHAFAEQLANLRQEAEAQIAHLRQEAVAALTAVGAQVRSEVQNLAEATTAREQHVASL